MFVEIDVLQCKTLIRGGCVVCELVQSYCQVGAQVNELSAHYLCDEAKHDTHVSQRCGGKLYFSAILTILCHVPEIHRGNVPTWEFHIPNQLDRGYLTILTFFAPRSMSKVVAHEQPQPQLFSCQHIEVNRKYINLYFNLMNLSKSFDISLTQYMCKVVHLLGGVDS